VRIQEPPPTQPLKHWASEFVPSKRVFLFAPGLRAAATRFIRFSLGSAWRRYLVLIGELNNQ